MLSVVQLPPSSVLKPFFFLSLEQNILPYTDSCLSLPGHTEAASGLPSYPAVTVPTLFLLFMRLFDHRLIWGALNHTCIQICVCCVRACMYVTPTYNYSIQHVASILPPFCTALLCLTKKYKTLHC